ncbi:unnamed protein product [Blepharisma stoltei]|uniref:Uncharacterized protein n=1 Tax=Blepharisma stoltei TaxID=1481888 RepID=A0AAU9JVI7_9CILI|nr:unnamed protein product [Blepharisma stoltei]
MENIRRMSAATINLDEDKAEMCFLAFGILIISIYLWNLIFLYMVRTPKIRSNIEELCDHIVYTIIQLQALDSIAYLSMDFPTGSYNMLGANKCWIYFNYLDSKAEQFITQTPRNFTSDFTASGEWTPYYFNNSFTCFIAAILYITVYLFVKIGTCLMKFKNFFLKEILEFEIGQQLLKVIYFKLAFNLFVELKFITDGAKPDWNSALCVIVSFFVFICYPFGKIILLRCKFRDRLDEPNIRIKCGSDYRVYKPCAREFHILVLQLELAIIACVICFISSYKSIQLFAIIAVSIFITSYTIIYLPYSSKLFNLEEIFQRLLRLSILCSIIGISSTNYPEYRNLLVFGLLLIWYLGKMFFTLLNVRKYLADVKKILTRSSFGSLKIQTSFKPKNDVEVSTIVETPSISPSIDDTKIGEIIEKTDKTENLEDPDTPGVDEINEKVIKAKTVDDRKAEKKKEVIKSKENSTDANNKTNINPKVKTRKKRRLSKNREKSNKKKQT